MDNEACIEGVGLLLRSSSLVGFFRLQKKKHLGPSPSGSFGLFSVF